MCPPFPDCTGNSHALGTEGEQGLAPKARQNVGRKWVVKLGQRLIL